MRSAVVRLLLIVILTANALCLFVQSQSPPQQQQQSQSLSAAAPSQRQVPRRRLGSRLIGGQTRRPAANGAGASAVGEQQRRRTERPGSRIGVRSGTGYRPMRQVPGSGANLLADERQSRQIRWPSRPMAVPAGTTSFELPDADAAFGLSELRCVQKPERLSFCSGIGYNKLRLPNRFQQDKVEEIVTALEEWRSLVVSRACHESALLLLLAFLSSDCALYSRHESTVVAFSPLHTRHSNILVHMYVHVCRPRGAAVHTVRPGMHREAYECGAAAVPRDVRGGALELPAGSRLTRLQLARPGSQLQ